MMQMETLARLEGKGLQEFLWWTTRKTLRALPFFQALRTFKNINPYFTLTTESLQMHQGPVKSYDCYYNN